MARGRQLLSSDLLPFTAPSYDLLSTATQLDLPSAKWRMGLKWEPLCPEADGTYDPCVAVVDNAGVAEPAPAPAAKDETTEWTIRGATPFTAYSRIDCSPVGVWDELSPRNQQSLVRAESRFVETAFWSGVASADETGTPQTTVFPHLAADTAVTDGGELLQPAATTVTTEPQEIVIALGMLEDAMRDCYPGTATIHMPIRLATIAADHGLITARSGLMHTTSLGSKVVIGDYPGTAPDGSTPPDGTTWMYATGEVFYVRENAPHTFRPVESFDRNVNTVAMLAERTYLIGWDCCLLAIPVLNGENTGV